MATRYGGVFAKFKERALAGASPLNLGSLTVKAMLINLSTWGLAVTGATNANPAVITTATHSLTTGDRVAIIGVGGNTNVNGVWRVVVLSATTFSLKDIDTDADVAGNAAYTSGGRVIKLDVDEFVSDIPVGDRGTMSGALGSKVFTKGAFDAADYSFASVPAATYPAVVYLNDTGVVGTSNLLSIVFGGTGFPLTVGSGSPTVNGTINAAGIFGL